MMGSYVFRPCTAGARPVGCGNTTYSFLGGWAMRTVSGKVSRREWLGLTAGFLAGGLVGCGSKNAAGDDPWGGRPGKRVLVSFAPLYRFASAVRGRDGHVGAPAPGGG